MPPGSGMTDDTHTIALGLERTLLEPAMHRDAPATRP